MDWVILTSLDTGKGPCLSCECDNKCFAELIQAGGKTLLSEIHKLVHSIWNKEELSDQWRSLLPYQFTRRGIELTVVIIMGYHCYQLHTKCYPISFCQV
jgi:hypothetical protein